MFKPPSKTSEKVESFGNAKKIGVAKEIGIVQAKGPKRVHSIPHGLLFNSNNSNYHLLSGERQHKKNKNTGVSLKIKFIQSKLFTHFKIKFHIKTKQNKTKGT